MGEAREQRRECIKKLEARPFWIDLLRTRSFSMRRRWPNNLGHQRGYLLNPGAKGFRQLREIRSLCARADDLDYRPECGCASALPASPPNDSQAAHLSARRQLVRQPSLANAGFARNQEHPPPTFREFV